MKMTIRLVLVLTLSTVSTSLTAEEAWVRKVDMPTPRWVHTSAAVNGKIYVIGGVSSEPSNWQSESGEMLSTVEEYDPAANRWVRKADMPTARGGIPMSSPVVDGKIYVIGGYGIDDLNWANSTVEMYHPPTDTWTRKADMPTPRWCLATCALDGKIYAIGGAPNIPDSYTGLKVVEVYDPATDTWTRKADMREGRWSLCVSVVNGKIYAMGGTQNLFAKNTMEEYDPATDTWKKKAYMITAVRGMGTSVWCGKIYVVGGWSASGASPYSSMQVYDTATDIWAMEGAMPAPRACLSTSVLDGKIYAIGGTHRPHPCTATSTVYELELDSPSPDFNGDGVVDGADIVIMVDHWLTDEPLCDIAPGPCGDGIVDVQDLIVFAEHLFDDYRAIAQWKLDEKAGDIAHDSVGGHDATLHGEPLWQPAGGRFASALQFDGIDDYISTNFVLDPSLGAFSVFAWIKGGAPGQVIISQVDGTGTGETWLGMDALGGNLMTGLVPRPVGRFIPQPLGSQTIITDGLWHHVGFVWDGSHRFLYADGVEVAKDTTAQAPLKSATGGLYIGTGKNLDTGSFFSGLIDDVRIYEVALSAEEIPTLAQ